MITPAEISTDEVQRVLEERARRLARPVAVAETGERLDLVTFRLGNENYGIEGKYVFEVFRLTDISPLPGATPPVFGVVAWRGNLLVILDLRLALGRSAAALNDLGRVIVLGNQRPAFGVLVDTVNDVTTIPAGAVSPVSGASREIIRGVTGDALVVLDAPKLLKLYS
jgi:purine-binding chemotaxis protein CheW